jgi:MFS family permease
MAMKYRHRVLALLASMSVLTYLDRVCISVAGPRLQNDLGLSPHQWGLATSAFGIAYALFEIPSGHFADRFGARAMLTRIVVWWSAFKSWGNYDGVLLSMAIALGLGAALWFLIDAAKPLRVTDPAPVAAPTPSRPH